MFDGRWIRDALIGVALVAFAAGFAVASILWLFVPWAWQYVKPWIHALTA